MPALSDVNSISNLNTLLSVDSVPSDSVIFLVTIKFPVSGIGSSVATFVAIRPFWFLSLLITA